MHYLDNWFVQSFVASSALFSVVAGAILASYDYGIVWLQSKTPPKG